MQAKGLSPQLGFPGFVGGLLVVVGTAGLLVVLVVVIGGGTKRVVVVGGTGGRTVLVVVRRVVVIGMGTVGPGVAHLPARQTQLASQSFSVLQGSPEEEVLALGRREAHGGGNRWHTQAVSWPDATGRYRVGGTSCGLDSRGGLARGGRRLDWAPGVCTLVVLADEVTITVSVCLALVACWCQYKNL